MKLVILDRDGVINYDSDNFIKSPKEWVPVPGSLEAIARLNAEGFKVAVATNQSGLARGYFDRNTLQAIHEKMRRLLSEVGGQIDALFFCPHGPDDVCECRKPKPGLLQQVAHTFNISLDRIPVIGDSLRDLQAAEAVKAQPILVRTGKGSKTEKELPASLRTIEIYDNLAQAVDTLISKASH